MNRQRDKKTKKKKWYMKKDDEPGTSPSMHQPVQCSGFNVHLLLPLKNPFSLSKEKKKKGEKEKEKTREENQ